MILRLFLFIFVILPLFIIFVPLQIIILALNLPFWHFLPRILFRITTKILGIEISLIGKVIEDKPTLLVANHISWIDILALGAVANISFVAKSEIKKWPLIGFLAALRKTIFVERKKRTDSKRTATEMAKRLKDGGAVVLFAEGGSNISAHILPFRSALLGAAQIAMQEAGAKDIVVQPVTIAYTKMQGLPISRTNMSQLAWNKSLNIIENIKQILQRPKIKIIIHFAQPLNLGQKQNRKEIAQKCHEIVRKNYNKLTRAQN